MKFSAPGKVVLWGEYAVLEGGPAVVMALERRASIELTDAVAGWSFRARGFLTPSVHQYSPAVAGAPVTQVVDACLTALGEEDYGDPFACVCDTSAFFHDGSKLGIGSSAALCTATYAAFARRFGYQPDYSTALQIHRTWQGGGSGLDVAAAWQGGVIEHYLDDSAPRSFELPADLHWQLVWTGTSSKTASHLRSFTEWRASGDRTILTDLVAAAADLTATTNEQNLANYRDVLHDFDSGAKLKIFTPEHDQLGKIAADFGLVYKPCGAGGGDIGIAMGCDPEATQEFAKQVSQTPFRALRVEIAKHGVIEETEG